MPKPFPQDPVIFLPQEYSHLRLSQAISQQQAMALEMGIRGQATSRLWHRERRLRLTASKYGSILKHQRAPTEIFLNSLSNQRIINARSITYGRGHERVARRSYSNSEQVHTHDCGLVVNPAFPFLGATPDAKVCDCDEFGIIEIKCPYSARDMTVAEAVHKRTIN